MLSTQLDVDVLVIGSGAAGLSVALELPAQHSVLVASKVTLPESATLYAQGGVSAVLDPEDSVEAHVADTLAAGAGLCDPQAVRFVAERARDRVEWLEQSGVAFSKERQPDGTETLHLTREGGHSCRRVVHVADATGRAIETALRERAEAEQRISLLENHLAIDLVLTDNESGAARCCGADFLDRESNEIRRVRARVVVLATGGAGKAYLYTSNPDIATGDGIAMAWRAGCRIANMEFFQFHPTCLFHPDAKSFLISEALRGEGAVLRHPDGTRFMADAHPDAELAPRDIVARSIDAVMKRDGLEHVLLDISHRDPEFIRGHFPTICQRCLQYGFDMCTEPLPVVPAAHYLCGGIATDLNARTNVRGLYAVGETACTGLHGANRMASNSLIECLVLGESAAQAIHQELCRPAAVTELSEPPRAETTPASESILVAHNWDELRRMMWDYVGIVRSLDRLQRARARIQVLADEVEEFYRVHDLGNDVIELRNLVVVADLIVRSAMSRHESRGLHYLQDYPRPAAGDPVATVIEGYRQVAAADARVAAT